jgi:hypothetical protein
MNDYVRCMLAMEHPLYYYGMAASCGKAIKQVNQINSHC